MFYNLCSYLVIIPKSENNNEFWKLNFQNLLQL